MGEDEAAGMLRKVPWRPDQLAGEVQGKAEPPVAEVEVQLFGVLGRAPSSDQPRTSEDSILIRSSGRPSALPTSRSAPLAR